MRKIYTKLLWLLIFAAGLLGANRSEAQSSGIFESYAILNINGAGNTFYDMQATTANPDFQGANLGTFCSANTLSLFGGQNKTFKNGGCDITNGNIWYRVYPTASPAGTYTSINEPFDVNLGPPGDQQWTTNSGTGADLLAGLTVSGNYTVEVYSSADYQGCGTGTHFSNAGGANYKATFNFNKTTGPLSGTYNIPSACYPTLASFVTALNTNGVGGPVTANLLAGNPQTAPAGGYVIGGTGSLILSGATATSATNQVTFNGNGNTITASGSLTAGALTDAIFKIIGGDFITIQNFTMTENAANTTTAAATNNMTEWGVALLYVSLTDGSQNNTIRNNTISLNRAYSNTFGVYSNTRHSATTIATTAEVTAASGSNSNNKVYTNTISNVDYGIVFVGASTAAAMDNGNDVGGAASGTGNIITNWGGLVSGAISSYISVTGSSACIYMNHQVGDNVSFNTITSATNITTLTTSGFLGILKAYTVGQPTGLTFTSNYNSNTVTLTNSGATTSQMTCIGMQGLTALSTATFNCNNNNILNSSVSGASITSSAMLGMLHSSAPGTFNITGNTIRGFSSAATTGGFVGIQQQTNGVVTALNITNNRIGDATAGAVAFSAATSGSVTGIAVTSTGAAATCALAITGNDFRGFVHSVAGSSTHTYISDASPVASLNVSSNTFTNLNVNTTGSATFIAHSYTMPAAGTQTISNNSIVTGFNKGGAGGTVTGTTTNGSSPNGTSTTYNGNNFSNITVTGATAITGINNTDGSTGSSNKTITNNSFSNWTGGTSALLGINVSYFPTGTSSISTNTLGSWTGQGAMTGISLNSSLNNGSPVNVNGNTISSLVSSGAGGAVVGITSSNTSTTINIGSNAISTLSSTGAVAVSGINNGGAATTVNITKNSICGLSGTNASSTVNGILTSVGTTVNISNNRIANLSASVANAANPVVGLNITGGTTVNAFYNSVLLGASSTGALFGSSAVSASTTPTLTLNNNIFVNNSTTSGAGLAAAYRRSTTTLTSYGATSDRNDFYGATIFTDGTNTDATLAAYKTRVSTRDANAISENPTFLSTVCGNANFLKVNTAIATQLESGGANVGGITDDFEGDIRQGNAGYAGTGTAPDIGADEFNGTPAVVCSGTPAATTINGAAAVCSGTGTTLSLANTYTDLGITHHWGSSTVSGGPYTGMGTGATQATGPLTVTTYFVDTIFCTNSGLFFVTPEKAVTINALPTVTVSPAAGVLCQPGATAITLTASGASTYAWSPAAGLSATTGAVVNANPSLTTTYTVTGTDGNGCINTATAAITVSNKPSAVTISPATPTICAGAIQMLTANGGGTAGTSAAIGAGTSFTTATGEQTAFCNRRLNYVGQTIYTAAELTAAGVTPGNITSMAYNISSNGDATSNANFTVKIGHEGSTTVFPSTSFFSNAAYTTVFGPATYTHASPGWQVITFATPFVWDGVSNICVDVRHDGIDAINNAQTQFTTTAGNASLYGFNTPATGTLSTTRLNVQFGYLNPATNIVWAPLTDLYTDAAATVAYTGSPSTAIVYAKPAATQAYTATSTNGAGCTSVGNVTVTVASGVTITGQPTAVTTCAGTKAYFKVSATGASLTYQWFKDGNPLSNGGTIGGVATDSLFINGVVAGDAGIYTVQVSSTCGSPVTSNGVAVLTVNAKPTVPVTPAGPVTICAPSTQSLDASGTNAAATVGYQWINNGAAIGGANSATYVVTASGNYRVRVQDGVTGCFDTSAIVAVTVNPQPTPVTISPAAPTVCAGTIQQLTANGGTLPATQQLGTGTTATTAGTTTSALGPNPLQSYYGGSKQQMIVTATELSGLGMANGSVISAVAFNLTNVEARTLQNLVVKVSNTALNAFTTTTFEPSGTVVRTAANYTPAAGWNTIPFNTNYTWDGTSNLLIEVNFSNNDAGGTGTNTAQYSTTGGATTLFYRVDNTAATAVDAATTASFAAYTQRNNIRFTYSAPNPISWSPTAGLFTDAGATTPYTGGAAASLYFKGTGTTYTLTATSGAGCSNTGSVTVTTTGVTGTTAIAGVVAAGGTTAESNSYAINGATDYLTACKAISTITPSGASPVSGNIANVVRVDTGATKMGTPRLYVARFYDVLPATNAATATGTVKLYFLQSEFDNYNTKALDSNYYPLPDNGANTIDSLRILIYHGTPAGGFFPGNYSGATEELSIADPGVSIVWNAAGNNGTGWWEVTFPANGYSGYFISSKPRPPLPVKVEYFRGAKQGGNHILDWKVVPVNTLNGTLTLERSSDGRSFGSIYSITASAVRMQQPFSYSTNNLLKGTNYYRLKMTDDNGVVTYSSIVALLNSSKGFELVNITPNPVTEGRFKLNITAAEQLKMEVVVTDMMGRIVSRQSNSLISGFNAVEVNVNGLANGMYQVMGIIEGERTKALKFVKE